MKSVETMTLSGENRTGQAVILALVAMLLLALAVRVWGISFGLPHRYHIDEPAYVLAALQLGQGNLKIAYPPLSPSLHQILLLGLFAILFLVQMLTGRASSPAAFAQQYQIDPSAFYLLARGLSAATSVVSIMLLFGLVRRLRGTTTALVSTLFLALCFIDVRHAHFVEPYALIALFCVATCYAAIRYVSSDKVQWIAAAGLACGIAVGMRFTVFSLGLVPVLAVALHALRQRPEGRLDVSLLAHHLVLITGALAAGMIIGTPSLLLNTSNTLSSSGTQALLALTTEGFWGFQFTDWPTWRFYGTILDLAWGWPLLLAAALGIVKAIRHHKDEDILMLAFPATFAVLLLSASAAASAFARYLVPLLPFLAFYAADGVVTVVGWLTRRQSLAIQRASLALVAGLLVILPATRIIQLNRLWTQTDTRTLAKQWIEENIPVGTKIALQWYSPALSTLYDLEPDSQRVYDAHVLNPFDGDPTLYTLETYRADGFEYMVVSSFIYRLARVDPLENQQRVDFYRSLDTDARLLAEFKPADDNQEIPFLFEEMWSPVVSLWQRDRPGPTIRIYEMPHD
ncbi:MAG: glycosyltransferase family 39 protein [Anaerolineae bacterium]|nr:glycosyltransferase family 39 protein [Anaerolineae bacterium]